MIRIIFLMTAFFQQGNSPEHRLEEKCSTCPRMAKLHQPGDIVKQSLRGRRSRHGIQDLVSTRTWIFLAVQKTVGFGASHGHLIWVHKTHRCLSYWSLVSPQHCTVAHRFPAKRPPMSITSTRFLPTKRSQKTTAKSANLPTLSTWLAVNKPQIPQILKQKKLL